MRTLREDILLHPLVHRGVHLWWRLARGVTFGVRGIVLDGGDRVFLVRHTYVRGWHLPGGGVEPGETALDALARELAEEGNLVLDGPPALHGLFFNARVSRRDHVAVYVVRAFRQTAPRGPDRELAETGFSPLAALPEGVTRGTVARLAELRDGAPVSAAW